MSPDRCHTFRALHDAGCFVMPNPWDCGSARLLEGLGFKALATTSAGFGWSRGKADNRVTLDEVLTHLRAIVSSVSVPVNADFEGGFATDAAGVAVNVAAAIATGIAGLSAHWSTTGGRRREPAQFRVCAGSHSVITHYHDSLHQRAR